MKFFSLLLVFAMFTQTAQARYIFSPSLSYMSKSMTDESGQKSNTKITMIDFRLGYQFDFGLYLGGLYSLQDQEIFQGSSDAYMGPSVGYWYEGLFVVATYHIYGERDLTAGGTKYSNGKGLQLDVSYVVPIAENIYIGPQLSWQQIKFDQMQVNGVAQAVTYKIQDITPYFNLTFIF